MESNHATGLGSTRQLIKIQAYGLHCHPKFARKQQGSKLPELAATSVVTSLLESPLKEIVLSNRSFGPQDIKLITQTIAEDFSQFAVFRDLVDELEVREDQTPAAAVRLGVCYYIMGRYQQCLHTLQRADGGAVTHFYQGKSHFALEEYGKAITSYDSAKSAGFDGDMCVLAIAEAKRIAGEAEEALTELNGLFGPIEQSAEYLYQRGATIAAQGDNPAEVVALYERAVEADESHSGALFGLALENDRRGNDYMALGLYKRATNCFPSNVGALLNLGILHEDMEDYDLAQQCYQRILDAYPNHQRAQLFLRDTGASGDMLYDEDAQKRLDRMTQVLNIPVSNFEMSIRSRNCLQKMGINSLGDLTRASESELMASKNFGETSLVEIRDMLHSKGLELGQFAHERPEVETPVDYSSFSPDEQTMLERPTSDLNLSVRARKCMVRLGMTSIGELLRKTGDNLLETKNFGVTSLNEVREKLTQMGLKLRGD